MNMSPYPRLPLKQMDGALLAFELYREIDRVVTDPDENDRVISAAMLATHLHRSQTRQVRAKLPRVPYIEHPLRNTLRLVRWGVTDPDTLAACLLHDVAEDCSVEIVENFMDQDLTHLRKGLGDAALKDATRADALAWIAESFNEDIATMVEYVSNPVAGSRLDYQGHVAQLAKSAQRHGTPVLVGATFIKASDLVDNPGSLIHQYGHVKDSFIIPKVAKYTPVVPAMRQAMETLPGEAAEAAAKSLTNVEHSLAQLAGLIEEADLRRRATQEPAAPENQIFTSRRPASIEDALTGLDARWPAAEPSDDDEPEL